jgi:signal transduction histidine kinase/DNA-binding NarL/FixJ family response regulator
MGITLEFSQIIDTVNITTLMVISLYHFLLFMGRKQYSDEKYNLYFSLSIFFTALSSFVISTFFQVIKHRYFHNVAIPPLFAGMTLALSYYFFVRLLSNLLKIDTPSPVLFRISYLIVGLAAMMPLLYLSGLITFYWYVKYLYLPVVLLFAIGVLIVIVYFIKWLYLKKYYRIKMVRILVVGLFSLIAYIIIDNLLNLLVPHYFSTYFNSFIGVFAIIFSYALSIKFNDEYNELVRLKSDLEHAVHQRTQELLESKNKIETLSQQRINYFVNLAHEIRTPLTLVKNYLDKYISTVGAHRDIHIVKKNIDKLCHDMINFLDSEKLERGQPFYDHDLITDFSELLNEKISLYNKLATAQGITFSGHTEPDIFIKADPTAVDRILNNLLDNAFKYTDKGGMVNVSLERDETFVKLVVKDSGIGISKAQQATIFQQYYQITHKKRNYQGMGIGLTIVKQIMDSLNATICIDSETNQGAQFTFTFKRFFPSFDKAIHPAPATEPSPVRQEIPLVKDHLSETKNSTILIVEDNVEMLTFLSEELSEHYQIVTADNGRNALKKMEHISPDMILSDVMMDEMDGYEFFEAVMTIERFKLIPFLFITARNSQLEKISRLSDGALDYIQKPFDMSELKARIETIIRYRSQQKKAGMQAAIDVLHGHLNDPEQPDAAKWRQFATTCNAYKITEREREIITLIDDGHEYKEIAEQLHISTKTVNRHIQNIYEKIAVSNKIEMLNLLFAPTGE